jgi:hypothetical protein
MLTESGWCKVAFARLMCIIHGRTRAVSRELDLMELAKMAQLVDYYDCLEVVEPYSTVWLQILNKTAEVPVDYGMELVLRLAVAWVFREADIFTKMTHYAVVRCRSGIQTMGFPIPEAVTGESFAQRFSPSR